MNGERGLRRGREERPRVRPGRYSMECKTLPPSNMSKMRQTLG